MSSNHSPLRADGTLTVDISVGHGLVIPDAELEVRFTPSGGPGGQHANRSNTRVELTWDIAGSAVLRESQRRLLVAKLGERVRVVVDDARSQARNRELAHERLGARVRQALVRPKPRRKTRPSRASKRRRVDAKRQRGELKKQRRRPGYDA